MKAVLERPLDLIDVHCQLEISLLYRTYVVMISHFVLVNLLYASNYVTLAKESLTVKDPLRCCLNRGENSQLLIIRLARKQCPHQSSSLICRPAKRARVSDPIRERLKLEPFIPYMVNDMNPATDW